MHRRWNVWTGPFGMFQTIRKLPERGNKTGRQMLQGEEEEWVKGKSCSHLKVRDHSFTLYRGEKWKDGLKKKCWWRQRRQIKSVPSNSSSCSRLKGESNIWMRVRRVWFRCYCPDKQTIPSNGNVIFFPPRLFLLLMTSSLSHADAAWLNALLLPLTTRRSKWKVSGAPVAVRHSSSEESKDEVFWLGDSGGCTYRRRRQRWSVNG